MLSSFIIKSFTMQQLFLIICPVCSSVWKNEMEQLLLRWFSWNEKIPEFSRVLLPKCLCMFFNRCDRGEKKPIIIFELKRKKLMPLFKKMSWEIFGSREQKNSFRWAFSKSFHLFFPSRKFHHIFETISWKPQYDQFSVIKSCWVLGLFCVKWVWK